MDEQILDAVHRYWFGDLVSPTDVPTPERMKAWFNPTPEIDATIRDTFGRYLDDANRVDWDPTTLSRPQQVGLVILLDQFPRQIFRENGRAFAYDAKARTVVNRLLEGGVGQFFPVERMFIILPLEHSEDVADQDRSVWLFAAETLAAPDSAKVGMRAALDYATKHRDLIRKFGRFPHRNALLGRPSTQEETEFLKGGRGF